MKYIAIVIGLRAQGGKRNSGARGATDPCAAAAQSGNSVTSNGLRRLLNHTRLMTGTRRSALTNAPLFNCVLNSR